MSYDFESRVTSLSGPGVSQTNTYNGLDTRVSKIENGASQTFVRDGAYVTDPVLRDSSAAYTPGISERRGTVSTFQHSGIKNAASQSSVSGSLSAFRVYDAFGNLESGGFGAWQGPFGYAGSFGYQEDGSGLRLLGHRYYDSSTGRFLTRDPIKDGRNWYGYGGGFGNPTGFTDSDGLTPKLLLIPLAAFLVKAVGNQTGKAIGKTISKTVKEILAELKEEAVETAISEAAEGVYIIPEDRGNGDVPYVGESGTIPGRMGTHEGRGRINDGDAVLIIPATGKTRNERRQIEREILDNLLGGKGNGNSNKINPPNSTEIRWKQYDVFLLQVEIYGKY